MRASLAFVAAFATVASLDAGTARAGEAPSDGPLVAADRHEAEGRALLERGDKVAAAKHMMEAWALRARAWAKERDGADAERVAALRAQAAAAKADAQTLREAGKVAEADARMEEASRLWKKAEGLQHDVVAREVKAREGGRVKGAATAEPADEAEHRAALEKKAEALAARRHEAEGVVKRLEAEAAELWAAGRMAAAEERLAKAAAIRAELKALSKATDAKQGGATGPHAADAEAKARKAHDEKAKAEARRAAETALVGEVRRLRQQVDELRAAVDELRARTAAPTPAK
jgi:colicin import membrane protein